MISLSKLLQQVLTEGTSFKNLLRGSEPGRIDRGRHDVNARSIRVITIDDTEAWTFNYKSHPSTTGQRWHGYVHFLKENVSNAKNVMDLECQVDCDCPDYRYRFAYNNDKAGVGKVGGQPEWKHANNNNGQPPRPRSQGGVGDYGVGMCKHLCSLGEFLKTEIEPDAPEPEDEKPLPKVVRPAPKVTPETPATTDAPEPEDAYTDSRSDGANPTDDTDDTGYNDTRSGLQENAGNLFSKMDRFVKTNPEFDVQYE